MCALEVVIEGLDPDRAKALEHDVRRTVVDRHARDVIRITVLPSAEASNQWDVGVRRATGWSVTWVDASPHDLAVHVVNRLRWL